MSDCLLTCRVCGRPIPVGSLDCSACMDASLRRAHPEKVELRPVYSGASHPPTSLYRVKGGRLDGVLLKAVMQI